MKCLKKAHPSRANRKAFSFISSVNFKICLASTMNRARNTLPGTLLHPSEVPGLFFHPLDGGKLLEENRCQLAEGVNRVRWQPVEPHSRVPLQCHGEALTYGRFIQPLETQVFVKVVQVVHQVGTSVIGIKIRYFELWQECPRPDFCCEQGLEHIGPSPAALAEDTVLNFFQFLLHVGWDCHLLSVEIVSQLIRFLVRTSLRGCPDLWRDIIPQNHLLSDAFLVTLDRFGVVPLRAFPLNPRTQVALKYTRGLTT
ncbi:hypothetical protein Nepgr_019014 [Nepenthes gracilis]|uniref:Uncharacterized protein n=1 Tax=Nepenthes gracilis TaxID=150966 RepID=A0AAD3XU02_NEPGR|nr:hypothetical protein Nepgr_019014 [Nepenthes gracilis]